MDSSIKDTVRNKYAELARKAMNTGNSSSCCSSCCSSCGPSCSPTGIGLEHYSSSETSEFPEGMLSLGCGNPTALADLKPGEIVLDLGSGAGLDVLLSARRVGPDGKAYGLDMTDEMLALARKNQQQSGITNVEFLKGDIENIPLPDSHVDVVISNCVINLAADKARVFSEIYRVLKPGGRIAIADMAWRQEVPAWLRQNVELWAGCVAGALTESDYRKMLSEAGFVDVDLEVLKVFTLQDAPEETAPDDMMERMAPYDGSLISVFVRGRKPSPA